MKGEEASDLLIGAIKYGFTDWAALVIGGLIFGAYVSILLLIGIVPAILWEGGQETRAVSVLVALAVPAIILTLYVTGYMACCMRSVIRGNEVLPSPLKHVAGILKLGVASLLIYLPYILFALLALSALMAVALPALIAAENAFLVIAFMAVLTAFSVLLGVLGFVVILQVVHYAATGRFLESLSPGTAVRLLLKDPFGFLVALAVYYVATLVFSLGAMTIVLYPWFFFLTVTAVSYIIAKHYRRITAPAARA